uniref:pyranose dehydrogenase (acceptor) n=1 Tax=Psilocybe cubensis TaxID=181762 RepID=A0A8H7XUR8_PSICU
MKNIYCVFLLLGAFFAGISATVFQNIGQLSTTSFDFIVVGGGTAGPVVANRLSENPNFHVLVIEAGPTNEGVLNAMIPSFSVQLQQTTFDWNYTTVPGIGLNNRTLAYPRGRILGGCSSHNAMFYTRGSMDDYDRWANITGDDGWNWKNILPYILKARLFIYNEKWTPPSDEHNTTGEFNPVVHGFNGLMFTSLPGSPQTIDNMILEVPDQLPDQFPFLLDMNAGKPLGLGWFQGTIGNGTRSSAATAYLSTAFTNRPNLHVLLNTKVKRISGSKIHGIPALNNVEIDGSQLTLTAEKEVILSAGPINTPQILMNSGIGDRNVLAKLQIPTVLHLPSVGQNLTDQPITTVLYSVNSNKPLDNLDTNATLQAQALAQWEFNRTGPLVDPGPNFIAWSRLSSNSAIIKEFGDPSAGQNTPHLELAPFSAFSIASQPGHTGGMAIAVVTPKSRGSVTLNSTDPFGKPIIDLGFFTDEFDIRAMIEAIKLSQVFYQAPVWKDYIISQVAPAVNATDAELEQYIRSTSATTLHGVGTAAMSAPDADYGVVNPNLLVKGASGLRIVDASIMPFINSGHPQAPVYAIAERASDLIKSFWN